MRYTDETLFVFAISEYTENNKNVISGHKDFSNVDFCKFAIGNDFSKFQNNCERKIKDLNHFYQFKDDIKTIIDAGFDENCDFNPIFREGNSKELMTLSKFSDGIISTFDNEFPKIYSSVKKDADKPYLLFYKGDLSLLEDLSRNVAVIGLLTPDENIIEREEVVVKKLVERGMNIVSGLAKGCDTIAHKACLEANGKTIAILPSPLSQIYPAENRELASEIVDNGGLLLTEYYKKPVSRFDSTKRFIDRDRLQAMFSKAILLSASYAEGMGDSGSRHAMGKAEEYSLFRAMLYDEKIDSNNPMFGLNKQYHATRKANVLTSNVLEKMINYSVSFEQKNMVYNEVSTQLRLEF